MREVSASSRTAAALEMAMAPPIPIAVVGRRPHGDERLVEHVLVALHHELMRSCDERNVVGAVELVDDVAAKQEASATRAQAPAVDLLGIRPQQVAHGTIVRHFLFAIDDANLTIVLVVVGTPISCETSKLGLHLPPKACESSAQYATHLVERVDRGRQAAVDAEDAVLDDGREAEVVKDLGAVAPHIDRAVLLEALIVEAVHLRDLAALVVAADQRDAVRVAHLERQQKQEGLDAVEAAVDVVAEEQVVGLGAVTADTEQLLEVVELPMDIAADLHASNRVSTSHTPVRDIYLIKKRDTLPSQAHRRVVRCSLR